MKDSDQRRAYIDVHVLQTVPPANVNRDDAGSPKQAIYGGVRRARVSSQAWKRAARVYLAQNQPVEAQGTRTKRLAELVAREVVRRSGADPEVATRIATAIVAASPIKMDGKRSQQTSYLLFFGHAQVSRIADQVIERLDQLASLEGDALKAAVADIDLAAILGEGHPLDVALFGRMVADLAELNVDAATQVAHAISTHPVDIQFDYFTAVDDENPKDETGAGMIGTVEFNSATLYRYATLAVHQLAENLGDGEALAPAARAFVEAFVKSMPGGHQNSFAHRTRPRLVLVVVREDQPVNLVTAFESPVSSADGLEAASARRLADELRTSVDMWGDRPRLIAASYQLPDGAAAHLAETVGPSMPFEDLLDRVAGVVNAGPQVAAK